MTHDRLVCANCAGPVREGRCAVCRAERARQARETGPLDLLSPAALGGLLLLLLALALLAHQASTA
ncbi:hypothetical protein MTQ01_20935 [Streptomyces sp. XM4193]|uniref:hypothetical protein n=1 Tax=Streptomyces sp. XM4193 TaxID=2929782 RepID=UPI001FFAADCC|nr:hypothetical protein [Streptomyces sp. XM4193]MCK1798446.1 hypothetical protein [Streptomyces sp. XM4193]